MSSPGNGVDGKQNKTTAFVLDHSGTLTTLPTLSGGKFDKAADINESGVVVGSSDTATSATQTAVVWRNGVPAALGVFPGGTFSAALKVNATGTAVGISSSATSGQQAVMFSGGQVTNQSRGPSPRPRRSTTAERSSGGAAMTTRPAPRTAFRTVRSRPSTP